MPRGRFQAGQRRGPYRSVIAAERAHERAMRAGFTKSGVISDPSGFYLIVA